MTTPTFSVIVAVYQAADVVADAVASALAQTFPPLEVVVCDDGSTDDVAGALTGFDERVRLVRIDHAGVAAARNAAVRVATGDFVVLLDADDVWLPRRLEAIAGVLAAQPDVDLVTTDAVLLDDGRVVGRFYDTTEFAHDEQRLAILDRNYVLGHVAVRRSRFLAIGGFDERLHCAEDWDLWIRLLLDGSRLALVDEPLSEYRARAGSLTADRVQALWARVATLEKTRTNPHLTAGERDALDEALARHRRRAQLVEAESALRAGGWSARRASLAVARNRDHGPRTRAKAATGAVAPGLAARWLDRRATTTGRTWLRRGGPRGD